jgi:N-acetylglucosaminyl-diphospho-decaprenol L-rhamnosyltransferase
LSLLIVIVNYRTPELALDCLASLAGQVGQIPGSRVVVVDNASPDSSADILAAALEARQWTAWASLVRSSHNLGFAGGNNLGLKSLRDSDEFVLLLNSDTLAGPAVLSHCRDQMLAQPKIGVMSCLLKNPDGSVQNAARKFPAPIASAAYCLGLPWLAPRAFAWADLEDPSWDRLTTQRDVDWIGGAFMFIRAQLIRTLGGLDEDFFFYGEDLEFCHRAHKAGYRVFYDPATWIVHLGGASSDPSKVAAAQRNVYAWQGKYLVQKKCYGRLAALLARGVDILAYSLRTFKLLIFGRWRSPELRQRRQTLWMLLRPLRVAPSARKI